MHSPIYQKKHQTINNHKNQKWRNVGNNNNNTNNTNHTEPEHSDPSNLGYFASYNEKLPTESMFIQLSESKYSPEIRNIVDEMIWQTVLLRNADRTEFSRCVKFKQFYIFLYHKTCAIYEMKSLQKEIKKLLTLNI